MPYLFIGWLLCFIFYKEAKLTTFKKKMVEDIEKARESTLRSARSSIRGQALEQVAMFLPNFPYLPSNVRFLGSPVDAIIFSGMSELRDSGSGEITIIISDIKTGNAKLTPIEKAIKKAVEEKRIRWETWRVTDTGMVLDTPPPKEDAIIQELLTEKE